jgi:hypothetical protein
MKIYTAKGFRGISTSYTGVVGCGGDKQEALSAINRELSKRSLGPLQARDLKELPLEVGARILQEGRAK